MIKKVIITITITITYSITYYPMSEWYTVYSLHATLYTYIDEISRLFILNSDCPQTMHE